MIKFFKDSYANLTTLSSNANAICFATDRKVLLLGGVEYGKDQVKVVAASGDIPSADAAGTFYFVTGEQAVYQKQAEGDPTVVLSSVTGAIGDLEAKLSTAYADGKIVIGTTSGITSSAFVPDTTSGDLALTGTALSTTLVNAATLKTQIDEVSSSKATLTAGSGIDVTSAASDGIVWTISAAVSDASTNSIGFDSNGKLTDNLEIRKLLSTDTGYNADYAASYALFNTKGSTAVQLGDAINIVKDQFLSGAELVTGTYNAGTFTPGTSTTDHKYIKLVFNVNTDDDSTDAETGAQDTIYLDVNDLVDVYTAGDGIDVSSTNVISIEKDASSEGFLTVSSAGILLSGVQDAIDEAASGIISGLSSYTAGTDEFVTAIGVDATGKLTGTAAQASASGVTFNAITSSASNVAVTGSDVQAAISSLATTITTTVSGLSASTVGDTTTYIQSISETDGIISAVSATLDASKVAYAHDEVTTVSGALDDIYTQIGNLDTLLSGLDYGPSGVVGTPSAGTAYSIVNTIEQSDGAISATLVDLTSENTYQAGVTEALSTGVTSANARVGITSGTQASANDQISNILADYLSFHTANGNLA